MEYTGIILRTDPFRESDRAVSVFSLESGLIRLIAKGSQKITSKNAMALEPCTLAEVGSVQGKEIAYTTSVQAENIFPNIKKDIHKSVGSLYIMQFLARVLTEQTVEKELWYDTLDWLELLNKKETVFYTRFLDAYMIRLMSRLGFTPDLVKSGIFSIADGTVISKEVARVQLQQKLPVLKINDTVKDILKLFLNGTWEEIAAIDIDYTASTALHRFIFSYVEYHLERSINDWEKVIASFE